MLDYAVLLGVDLRLHAGGADIWCYVMAAFSTIYFMNILSACEHSF